MRAYDLNHRRKRQLEERMIESSTLLTIPEHSTLLISSTPDLQYLPESDRAHTLSRPLK